MPNTPNLATPMDHEIQKKQKQKKHIVQILLLLYPFILWVMMILAISHFSFSINVPVHHIEVHEKHFFLLLLLQILSIFV